MADPVMVLAKEDDPTCGIKKKVRFAGRGELPEYKEGTKVKFHYVTNTTGADAKQIDDSRKTGDPLELYIGKKFKLEVWETCLKSMREGEVASFTCVPSLVHSYPVVAKSLREIRAGKKPEERKHCCGMTLQDQGLGYADLDELLKNPQELEFTLEMVQVEQPGSYKEETWTLSADKKLEKVPILKFAGNELYKQGDHKNAAEKYAEAIGILEQLSLREKPGEAEWKKLDDQKIPLLLNFAQCKLLSKDYYPVIEHTSEVLKKDPDNVKALFRRAKAHVGAWNPPDAKADFQRVMELDASLRKSVLKEMTQLEAMEKKKDEEDKALLKGKMFT